MKNIWTHRVIAWLVALVLLVSGFAKAADASYFSNLIWRTFHSEWMAMAAPAVIFAEILLGTLLLIRWKERMTASLTALLLVTVTGFYLYGVLAFGMTSCGCFGHLTALNLPPAGTIARNGVLLVLTLLLTVFPTPAPSVHRGILQAVVLCLSLTIAAFATGYTMRGATVLFLRGQSWEEQTTASTPLRDLGLNRDSTYIVFAFSFDCPYCQMAIGNISLYEKAKVADRVIGLAADNPQAEQEFLQCYGESPLTYEVRPKETIYRYAPELPTAWWIEKDTIRAVWVGEVPPASFIK